jgi:hypothetical protein
MHMLAEGRTRSRINAHLIAACGGKALVLISIVVAAIRAIFRKRLAMLVSSGFVDPTKAGLVSGRSMCRDLGADLRRLPVMGR